MPRNTKGGTGHKKRKNKPTIKTRKVEEIAKDFNREEFEVYGQVLSARGNRRFEVRCQQIDEPDETFSLICSIKGSYRKRISKDAYVLIKLFNYNPGAPASKQQGQIIDSYTGDELRAIKSSGLWDFPEGEDKPKRDMEMPDMSDSDSETDEDESGEDGADASGGGKTVAEEDDFDIDNI